jgi:predicted amidohydrolase YtcJ
LPHKDLLDRWIEDRPAAMRCYDGHTTWLNSRALQAAGITRATPDPANGVIVRDPSSGEPTGVLKESAQALLDGILPEPSREESLALLRTGIAQAHRWGVTSVQDAGVGLKELDLFETLRRQGQLQLRLRLALEVRTNFIDADLAQLDQLKRRFPELNIGAAKLFADGVIEAHTAAMLAPYANRPTKGISESTPAVLNRVLESLDRQGWQIMVHAIGDGGIRNTLDALERAQQVNPRPERGRRHRLEHIESISSEDVGRFAQLGVIASMQPYHANPNGNLFQVWAANLGPERTSRAWIWKSIQTAGGRLAFGSDWPVVSLDPRLGIHTALTRQTLSGQPPEGFLPEQRLSLAETLAIYTQGSAYAEFADEMKGTLEVGKLADVVIWSDDLFARTPEQVRTAEVVTTILGGQIVYQR